MKKIHQNQVKYTQNINKKHVSFLGHRKQYYRFTVIITYRTKIKLMKIG